MGGCFCRQGGHCTTFHVGGRSLEYDPLAIASDTLQDLCHLPLILLSMILCQQGVLIQFPGHAHFTYVHSVITNCGVRILLIHYLLTPWCRVLLEKLTGLQLVKKVPAFYGTRRFITALTSVRHLSLSCASPIQSTHPHPTSWRSIPILSKHLRLGLPNGLFPSGFPTKTLYYW